MRVGGIRRALCGSPSAAGAPVPDAHLALDAREGLCADCFPLPSGAATVGGSGRVPRSVVRAAARGCPYGPEKCGKLDGDHSTWWSSAALGPP